MLCNLGQEKNIWYVSFTKDVSIPDTSTSTRFGQNENIVLKLVHLEVSNLDNPVTSSTFSKPLKSPLAPSVPRSTLPTMLIFFANLSE